MIVSCEKLKSRINDACKARLLPQNVSGIQLGYTLKGVTMTVEFYPTEELLDCLGMHVYDAPEPR